MEDDDDEELPPGTEAKTWGPRTWTFPARVVTNRLLRLVDTVTADLHLHQITHK